MIKEGATFFQKFYHVYRIIIWNHKNFVLRLERDKGPFEGRKAVKGSHSF